MFNINLANALSGAAGAYNQKAIEDRQLEQKKEIANLAFDNHMKTLQASSDIESQQAMKMNQWQYDNQKQRTREQVQQQRQLWNDDPTYSQKDREEQKRFLDFVDITGSFDKGMELHTKFTNKGMTPKEKSDWDTASELNDRLKIIKSTNKYTSEQLDHPQIRQMVIDQAMEGLQFHDKTLLDHTIKQNFQKPEKTGSYVLTNKDGTVMHKDVGNGEAILSKDEIANGWSYNHGNTNDITPDEMQALKTMMTKYGLPPSMINSRGPRTKAMAQSFMEDPNYRPQVSQLDFESKEAYQKYMNSGNVQSGLKSMEAVNHHLDRLDQISQEFTRSKYAPLNRIQLVKDANSGNETAAGYVAVTNLIAGEIGKVLEGGGTGSGTSDKKLNEAKDIISASHSPGQIKRTIKEIKNLFEERKKAITSDSSIGVSGGSSKPKKDPLGLFE